MTHEQNIQQLLDAVYGEEVRTSLVELFNDDYDLSKIKFGTSNPTGTTFTDGTTYINSSTWDVFRLEGTTWSKVGNIKGDSITVESSKEGKVTTILIKNATTGAIISTLSILDGKDGSGSGDMSASVYDKNSNGVVDFAEALFEASSGESLEFNDVASKQWVNSNISGIDNDSIDDIVDEVWT